MDPLKMEAPERNKIEAADRRFVDKLQGLRVKLADRQASWKDRATGRPMRRHAALTVLILLIAGAGLALFHKSRSVSPRPPAPLAARQSPQPKAESPRPPPPVPHGAARAREKRPSVPKAVVTPPAATPPQPAVAKGQAPAGNGKVPAGEPAPATEANGQNILALTALSCRGARHRQPLETGAVFHMGDGCRVYVWMQVLSKTQPFIIKHVYYHNAHPYCEVPLSIAYPRMRTWSYVTLGKASQLGRWTVYITCNGRVLKTINFKVIP